MNMKELEALVKEQGVMIEAMEKRAVDQGSVIEAMKGQIEEHRASIVDLIKGLNDDVDHGIYAVGVKPEGVDESVWALLIAHRASIEELDILVKGRNKSAATKRNMTDDDAKRVLFGDLKDLNHKDAAEKIGLTYAQVYSCRGEYTFKHVFHDHRKADSAWVNPWKK